MPAQETHRAGSPVWADFSTSDMEATKRFYTGLFGWTFDPSSPAEYGGYTNARLKGKFIAGFMPHQPDMGEPNWWTVYFKSDDLEATTKRVAEAGGTVNLPPMHVAPYGHMAVFTAPGGAGLGGWQPETHEGFGFLAEHGAPAWFETLTRSYPEAVEFYRRAFGWDTHVMSDTKEFRYTINAEEKNATAGIMDASNLPKSVPSHWAVYWGVDDTDKAAARAVELGGKIVEAPKDSPYGRVAELRDATGGMLRIVSVGK